MSRNLFDPWAPADWRRIIATPKVFISGPMFSTSEKQQQEEIANALAVNGFSTILPHRDGIEVAPLMDLLNDPGLGVLLEAPTIDRCIAWITRTIACLDAYWATSSACTVLNIDGRVPDEGSLVEATAAWMRGHPVIVFQSSPIRKLGKNNNPMIGLISRWTRVEPTLAGLVDAVAAVTTNAVGPPAAVPLGVSEVVSAGRLIAGYLGDYVDPISMEVVSVVEPDPILWPMCRFVLHAIIDFSKADTPEIRAKILLDGIDAVRGYNEQADVANAMARPLPC